MSFFSQAAADNHNKWIKNQAAALRAALGLDQARMLATPLGSPLEITLTGAQADNLRTLLATMEMGPFGE